MSSLQKNTAANENLPHLIRTEIRLLLHSDVSFGIFLEVKVTCDQMICTVTLNEITDEHLEH